MVFVFEFERSIKDHILNKSTKMMRFVNTCHRYQQTLHSSKQVNSFHTGRKQHNGSYRRTTSTPHIVRVIKHDVLSG